LTKRGVSQSPQGVENSRDPSSDFLLRHSKYLNNLVEQDHRFIKRLVKPGLGFFTFETEGKTLQGYEAMNILRKRQVQEVNRGDGLSQAAFIAELFGVAI
jgi:IS6 family transposase